MAAQVRAEFERYEAALSADDVSTLNAAFWASPEVRRFGIADEQCGIEELQAWRAGQHIPPGRYLEGTHVLVLGPDVAVVTTRFGYGEAAATGRQTQVWVRRPEGWRIVSAHVSESRPC